MSSGLPFRFTDERTVKFVELYGREPCLWNKRPYLRGARNAAYRRILAGINANIDRGENELSIQGVKMKIKNLRTGYHQELKKIKSNPRRYRPKMPWFAPLHKFLAEFVDTSEHDNETCEAPQLKRLSVRLHRLKPIKLQEGVKLEPEEIVTTEPDIMPTAPPLFTVLPVTMPIEHHPPTPPPSLPKVPEVSVMPSSHSDRSETRGEDEFTCFGMSVAAQLRNMPIPNAMVMQSKIQYILSMERRKITGHAGDMNIFN
ncbi:uncharacterized protein LOC111074523 [Drosophila obscura]|uniref:uncharacterized protein LOC111074523 n=1 Tax=Drosophila obscura TaxID=7282 RepID=UPI001BB1A91F|nr:uncharacterized protein LOC111074523 [Drosophila obscura]